MLALTIMFSMKFLGFLMLSVRNEAVSQILALLVLENGIFLGSQILVPGMPMLIEIVILFDLLIVVACFGMLVRFLVVHAGTTSSRNFKGWWVEDMAQQLAHSFCLPLRLAAAILSFCSPATRLAEYQQ